MKKLLITLSFLFLLTPLSAFASVAVGWNATSTDKGFISPNKINGNNPDVKLNGSLTINTLSGILKAVSGVVQTALVDLTADVSGILPVANGGTGAASFTAGTRFVISNGTGAFTSVAAPLTVSNGGTGSTTLTGLLKGNGTGIVATAGAGTDYTLITANTCGAGNHVSAITALGVITCSADSGSGGSGLATSSPVSAGNLLTYSAIGAGSAYGTATSTLTAGTGLTGSFTQVGSGGSLALSVPVSIANGGTATTTFYNKGLVFSDGSKLTQAAGSGASTLNWDNTNGRLGIGTTTPGTPLSVVGNIQAWGNTYNHFGESTCNGSLQGFGDALEVCGNQNADGSAPQIQVGNNNSGTAAYSGLDINNDRGDNSFTHFFGLFLNSSGYTSPTFGSLFPFADLGAIQNTDGALTLMADTNNNANKNYINFAIGGPNTSNEVARLTGTGRLGIGTTTPSASVSVDANNTATQKGLSLASQGTPYFTVATSSGTAVNIATSSAIGSNVLTVNGGVYFHGLATGAGNGALCATTDGLVSYDAGANCIVSSLRFKNVDATITPEESLATVLKLSPIFFHYKQGYGDNGKAQQEGFGAEEVAKVDTNLVQYDAHGDPFSVFYQNITAKLVGAVQAIWNRLDYQQQEIDQLKTQVKALQDAQQRPLPKQL